MAGQDDMTRYLARWQAGQSLSHAKHLAEVVQHKLCWKSSRGWSINSFYWKDRSTERQVVDWLSDPARRSEMEQAFFVLTRNDEDAAQISAAAEQLTVQFG